MKKAQISVVYLGLLSMVSIILLGIVFIWFNSMKDNVAVEFNEKHAESLLTGFEQKLVELKNIVETPNGSVRANSANITVLIPENIGEENYFVRGDKNDLVLQISGKGVRQRRKTIFRKRVYWWDTNFIGGAFSGNGELLFNYNRTTGNVTIS